MSYTPEIIFHWADIKPEHHKEIIDRREDDHAYRALADDLQSFLIEPKWLRQFKGQTYGYLSPQFSSHTETYKQWLDGWGVEYFEIGG